MKKSSSQKKTSKISSIILKIMVWFMAIVAVGVVCAVSLWSYSIKPATTSENEIRERVRVPAGASIRYVANDLKEKNLIKSPVSLYLAARFNLFDRNSVFCLKSGVYTVKSSMSLKEIYNLLQSGEQEYISVSIPEGLTVSKIAQILENKEVCLKEDFIGACKNPDVIKNISFLSDFNIETVEGFLFPDTYFFTPSMNPEKIIEIMVKNFFEKTAEIPNFSKLSKAQQYQKLTLAGIIEREYRLAEEAPLISSVFTNRLRYNIGLYSCATVEYIITEIEGRPHPERITYKDLKIDSPYNTYLYAGLTPTPISNPGKIAINAAVNPAKTPYYYFVLTDPATGKHTFSANFDEHKAAENTTYVSK